MQNNGQDILTHLYGILGRVVLLPIPLGRKGPQDQDWQKITFEDTERRLAYRQRLCECCNRGGNIGVLLGPPSADLHTIDIDDDELGEMFLADNPFLANSLRTKGKRGFQIWVRLLPGTGSPSKQSVYPLKTLEGNDYGEWRYAGVQSVIFGVHPDGPIYQFLVDTEPLLIDFTRIKWLGPPPEDKEENPWEEFHFPPVIDSHTIDPAKIILPATIIEGLLSLTEKLELAGGSKSFKTWSLIDMALSVAQGAPWWNQPTFQRHVVYLNMELSRPFFETRLVEVARIRELRLPDTLHVVHLRGAKLHDSERWEAFLSYLESLLSRFPEPLWISDPIYKMLGGKSENSAGDINMMMDQLEDLIQRTQGANVFGHHFSKGNQAEKEAIDRASGSGVFQRDPDTLLTVTKHENDNCYSVGAILRNHAPFADFVLEWHYPIFVARKDLDPENLKKPTGRPVKFTVSQLVHLLGDRCLKTSGFKKRAADELGMSKTVFFELLKKATDQNLISKDITSEEWEIIQKPT